MTHRATCTSVLEIRGPGEGTSSAGTLKRVRVPADERSRGRCVLPGGVLGGSVPGRRARARRHCGDGERRLRAPRSLRQYHAWLGPRRMGQGEAVRPGHGLAEGALNASRREPRHEQQRARRVFPRLRKQRVGHIGPVSTGVKDDS